MSKRKLLLANNPLLAGPNLDERVRPFVPSTPAAKSASPYREVLLSEIHRDPSQPRKVFDEEKIRELADSIAEFGVLSPLLVRERREGGYLLIAGERRFRASTLAGLERVPVVLEVQDREKSDVLSMQLVENLQREDLNSVERAEAIAALRDAFGLSVRDIAKKLSISKSMVQRSLDVLQLPPDLLEALKQGASESKVLMLARISDPDVRASLLEDLDLLTRGELEKEIVGSQKAGRITNQQAGKSLLGSTEDRRVADEIQRSLGMKVVLQRAKRGSSGRLVIDFYNQDDLQEIFKRLVVGE
jgi:ParB family chromosome partitioning protein